MIRNPPFSTQIKDPITSKAPNLVINLPKYGEQFLPVVTIHESASSNIQWLNQVSLYSTTRHASCDANSI